MKYKAEQRAKEAAEKEAGNTGADEEEAKN